MDVLDKLSIISDDKEEIVTIIFTFSENGKNYVVFEFDESKEISAARYVEGATPEEGELLDIETEEEWELVDRVFEQYQKDLEAEESEDDIEA
ncbi:DUF1292 domain-containing protein [Acholeplasma hippikon]|uniref:Uncharacterized protein conserved in bacteria n=1 Tax=Acholeplasma hippikon TaxID=264636 RepID=A0A449BJF2_9MOLU|nr:DUF1292 domain-containing protein [Acholeplasma hippikon]VEU82594.1 Uncharacterized protein conserved in bacteria [Acholeplasma hippikon]